ncbi:MAG TPA: SBBP repeat-containing protein [Rubricoccaceae bacterium]|nr:SBBP repeat-containing protein [Rubricoccaceae bacterium]
MRSLLLLPARPVAPALLLALLTLTAGPSAAQNWAWARGEGGPGLDEATNVDVDAAGNVYVVGRFAGTADFGGVTLTSSGPEDVFAAKYDPSGNVLWARRGGGGGIEDWGYSVAVDAAGNVYVCGMFTMAADFGGVTLTSAGARDAFLVKYDPSGNVLWARRGGGDAGDRAIDVEVDGAGNVYLAGVYSTTADFAPFTLTSVGGGDAFLVKYDPSGTALFAVSGGGATLHDWGNAVALDGSGNIYVSGYFNTGADFGDQSVVAAGGIDAFVVKYDAAGQAIWARSMGGPGDDLGYALDVDGAGNAYAAGLFNSGPNATGQGTFGGVTLTSAGVEDAYLVKFDPDGNGVWARSGGGTVYDDAVALRVTPAGQAVLGGEFDVAATFGSLSLTSAGGGDAYVVVYDAAGNPSWAMQGGGPGNDWTTGLALVSTGGILVSGVFAETATFGPHAVTSAGDIDAFVARINASATGTEGPSPELAASLALAPNPSHDAVAVAVVVPAPQAVTVEVYDALGRRVATLHEGALSAGRHAFTLDGTRLPPGAYVVRATMEGRTLTRTLTQVR